MALNLESLSKSIDDLNRSLHVVESQKEYPDEDILLTFRSGVIQNFEVAYEQCWKIMKRWLEFNLGSTYVDGVTRRELFRLSAEHQLITDVEKWMEYHDARNKTSHIYDSETANDVFETAQIFIKDACDFLNRIKSRND